MRLSISLWIAGGVLGFFIGSQDAHSISDDGEPITLLLLAASAGALGFLEPRRTWRWAIPVGLGLPLVNIAARMLGYHDHFHPDTYAARLLLAPVGLLAAVVGAYGGAALGRLRRRFSQNEP